MLITISSSFEEKTEFLFTHNECPDPREIRSSLNILRLEIKRNFENKSIWSGIMCMMAGIDLAAKFYPENYGIKRVEDRFTNYVKDIMQLDDNEAKLVYVSRNAFVHSFGLFSVHKKKPYYIHPRYSINSKVLVRKNSKIGVAEHYELEFQLLFKIFEDTLVLLKADILKHGGEEFMRRFNEYGTDKPLFEGSSFIDYCNVKG